MAGLFRKVVRAPSRVSGYRRTIRDARSRSLVIVMYHGVVREPLPVFNWCQLDLSRFEEQIKFLISEYRVIPLRELVDRLRQERPLPERAAVITFDDGYRSVYTTAFPVLNHYQVPFTMFLITGLVGGREPAWPERLFNALAASNEQSIRFAQANWPLITAEQRAVAYRTICCRLKRMDVSQKDETLGQLLDTLGVIEATDPTFHLVNWEEVEWLHRTGLADFGSHTHTHQILSRCDPERQRSELRKSRDLLQQNLGNADLFAYPNGGQDDFTKLTSTTLKELNYRCALTTIPGLNRPGSDLYELRRVGVGANDSLADYEMLLLGF